jgi:high affinity Mn2+ porin
MLGQEANVPRKSSVARPSFFAVSAVLISVAGPLAWAGDENNSDSGEEWAIHGQTTFVEQYHPAFDSPYQGRNSLDPGNRGDETWDATVYAGVRPWTGGEVWINGEIDQGFGLSNSLGIAGFPNGEAYKIGSSEPYPKLPRLFFRQTFDLGGETSKVESDINQLGGSKVANRIVLTIGKFATADVFDHNTYSDDSKHTFLNWALVDLATFDYAANAWGYTYGAAMEWYQGAWALRTGIFDLSSTPNSSDLDPVFLRQFQIVAEGEDDYHLFNQAGVIRVLSFMSHGRMGLFSQAIALSQEEGAPATLIPVRRLHERAGVGLNMEQHITDDVGVFLRTGYDDPSREPFEFIDVDETVSGGISASGTSWGRKEDTAGLAIIVNGISREHASYFNAGGLGILIGDGRLPHPGNEQILEALYTISVVGSLKLTVDYQFIANPAYNEDRGPVSVIGMRAHAEF